MESEGLNAVALLVPVVVYLSLSQLPAGRGALIGIGFAAIVCALAWIGAPPMRGVAGLAVLAVGAAALVQGVRALMGPQLTRGAYWALVGLPVFVAAAYLFTGGA